MRDHGSPSGHLFEGDGPICGGSAASRSRSCWRYHSFRSGRLTTPASFKACAVSEGKCYSIGAAFYYGDKVVVRGKVKPPHEGAVANRRQAAMATPIADRIGLLPRPVALAAASGST